MATSNWHKHLGLVRLADAVNGQREWGGSELHSLEQECSLPSCIGEPVTKVRTAPLSLTLLPSLFSHHLAILLWPNRLFFNNPKQRNQREVFINRFYLGWLSNRILTVLQRYENNRQVDVTVLSE